MKELNMQGALVFDRVKVNPVNYPTRSSTGYLEIIYPPSNLSADDYILEFLSTTDIPNLILISSDGDLCRAAKNLGAKIKSVPAFIELLKKQKKKITHLEDGKPSVTTDKEFERFLSIFEDRYNNH